MWALRQLFSINISSRVLFDLNWFEFVNKMFHLMTIFFFCVFSPNFFPSLFKTTFSYRELYRKSFTMRLENLVVFRLAVSRCATLFFSSVFTIPSRCWWVSCSRLRDSKPIMRTQPESVREFFHVYKHHVNFSIHFVLLHVTMTQGKAVCCCWWYEIRKRRVEPLFTD